MDWLGYDLDFYGMEWIGPVLGSVIFFWAGWPFLSGGWQELLLASSDQHHARRGAVMGGRSPAPAHP